MASVNCRLYVVILLWTDSTNSHCTHTHPFNGPLSGTTRVSRYQKGKTNLDFTDARDSEWQWHQLGYMQVCTSLQVDNHTAQFSGRMPFLSPMNSVKALKAYCTVAGKSVTGVYLSWTYKAHFTCIVYCCLVVFTARCYASAVLAMALCLSIRLSITSRSSTKMAKRRITQTTTHDSPGTLVFWSQRSLWNSTGVTPYWGAKFRWGGSKSSTFDK